MDEQNQQDQETVEQARLLIESKLSKTEAIELMVAEMLKELRRAKNNAEAELQKILRSFTFDELQSVIAEGKLQVDFDEYEDEDKPNLNISINTSVKTASAIPAITVRFTRLRELKRNLTRMRADIHKLENEKQATKVSILKSILEQTVEGRAMLTQLDKIRRQALPRLGIKTDPRLLSGKV